MKTHHISFLALVAALFACAPHAVLGYFTTGQSALKINDQVALYALEYTFGLEDHDIYMPIVSTRGLSHESDAPQVGFTLREDGEEAVTHGTAAGLVLSGAPIVDGMYKIAKDTAQKMTLFVVFATEADTLEADYALQIDRLPYYVDKGDDELQELSLNPSELQYYITPEIELNSANTH